MKIFVVSGFSKGELGGNLAGVCLTGELVSREKKQAIAQKLGYSETVFVSASMVDDALFKLEYYTPNEEVSLCGHATIAAFCVMNKIGILKKESFKIETKAGVLDIVLEKETVFMQQNLPAFYETLSSNVFAKCFEGYLTHDDYPIQIVSTGLKDVMLPVIDKNTLDNLKPDFSEIIHLSKELDCVGIHAFAISQGEIHVRNFAPLYEINEESATGTSNCALACYLYEHNILKQNDYVMNQGEGLGQPSQIKVNLETSEGMITKVTVGGTGYVVKELWID